MPQDTMHIPKGYILFFTSGPVNSGVYTYINDVDSAQTIIAPSTAYSIGPFEEARNYRLDYINDPLSYNLSAAPSEEIEIKIPKALIAKLEGKLEVFNGTMFWSPQYDITMTKVTIEMGTAPVDGPAVFNIRKNETVIFNEELPTVEVGQLQSTPLLLSMNVTTTDKITIDCVTANGYDAIVRIDYI